MADRVTESPQKPADARAEGDRVGHGAKTAETREQAILALLSCRSIGEAARRAKVHERTLRRWLSEDSEFIRELATARRVAFEAGMHRVQALTATAVDTLAELMDKTAPPAVRLGAARTVAELGMHQHDVEVVLRRVEGLEAKLREQGGNSWR